MCTDACRAAWPPLLLPAGVTTATPGAGVTGALGPITRPNGGTQVTYRVGRSICIPGIRIPAKRTGKLSRVCGSP